MAAAAMIASVLPATAASAQQPPIDPEDPRVGLEEGYRAGEAGEAASGIEHLANVPKPEGGFSDGDEAPLGATGIGQANSDLAFSGDFAFMGSYNGWTVYDIADPAEPTLEVAYVCPGGQGDVSIHGDLLFVSVEQASARVDCGTDPAVGERFQGVRIFDVGSILDGSGGDEVTQVAAVQACRGSHTHTLVEDLDDPDTMYVYVSGTTSVRPADTLEGCANPDKDDPDFDEDSSRFRIDVIEVPLDAPEDAAIVNQPRLFTDEAGNIDGLNPGGSQGAGFQTVAETDACHDITAYPEIGLAAGACEGNGILIDITDPATPTRVDEIADRNFAYWHSATWSNDGSKVVFTDEWGGGLGARCQETDRPQWGANAIFDVVDGDDGPELRFVQYYKLPAPQTASENCVAHNGTLVPVPGRDVMVQAWYQGGVSLWDFTDSASPYEIGYFDRGPTRTDGPSANLGGFWSAYWYDGNIYGSEIVRGFDTFELSPTEFLSAAEIDRAEAVSFGEQWNAQAQVSYEVEPVPAACERVEPVGFPDVSAPPHAANIECIAAFRIAEGFADGEFKPAQNVRRDQMAAFLARMLRVGGVELPEPTEDRFPDADASVHVEAIRGLGEAGIVEGRADGSYNPRGFVTRDQMASFLVRTLEFALDTELSAERAPFTDVSANGPHASNIDIAYALGIAEGRTETTFEPRRQVRRDQMGSFLARTLDVMDAEGFELTPLPSDG